MISVAAQDHPIVTPNPGLPLTGKSGQLTGLGAIALQQMRDYIVNMNRTIPANASGTNKITLTLLNIQPTVTQYVAYESFAAVAVNDSTGPVTAIVVTKSGSLPELKVFKNNGVQADDGDVLQSALYRFTYNDALDSGAGGFVLDGNAAATIVALTDSSGGVASNDIVAVSGSGDDTDINNNFAALSAKLNAILSAIGAT